MKKIATAMPEAIQQLKKEEKPLVSSEPKLNEYEERQKRRQEQKIRATIQDILPVKYWDITTDRTDLLNKHYEQSLFIYGASGTGKSVFAASLAKKYITAGKSLKWNSFPKLIMTLQSMFKHSEEDPFAVVSKEIANFTGVLFLDDFGAEKLTDYVRQIMYFILNEREENLRITIITSNFNLEQIDEQIDSRVSSRIAGMCEVLQFTGKDRRIK